MTQIDQKKKSLHFTSNFQLGHPWVDVSHYNIRLQVLIYKLTVIKSCIDSIPLSKLHYIKIHLNSYIVITDGGEQTKLTHIFFIVNELGGGTFLITVVMKEKVSHRFSLSALL